MGISESMRIRTLESVKRDLMDDNSAISSLRSKVRNLQDAFDSVIMKAPGKDAVRSKLDELSEPFQYGDQDLKQTEHYIDMEIQALRRDAEQKQQSSGGGGYR